MVIDTLSDLERLLLLQLIDAALFAIGDDTLTAERLASIRRKLGGTDKRVVVDEC
jgi:hypothetical protein